MSASIDHPMAILTDTTKCIGCRECVLACRKINHLNPDTPRRWSLDDGLSARNWTSIIEKEQVNGDPAFIRKQCRHCNEPACVSVCPVGAMRKTETGAVIYDSSRCMGCRYCMIACPYGVPRYDWDQQVPYVRKCILCYDTIKLGGKPACTEACPTGATVFGTRGDLLAEAHKRLAENPERYIQHVWGENEIGGTSVLYLSDTDLSFLSYGARLGDQSLPAETKTAMGAVPPVFVGMAGTMTGIYWIIKRRMKHLQNGNDAAAGHHQPEEHGHD